MFYVIFGTDTKKSRAKLKGLLALAKKKRPEAELFRLTSENFSAGTLEELLVSWGLFEEKYTTVLDMVFENKEYKSDVLSRAKEMAESSQIFLILEGALDAEAKKKLEKYAEKMEEHTLVKEEKKDNEIFKLTDYIAARRGRDAWKLYTKLLSIGTAPEEIHGLVFWQIKNILLSYKGGQKETGLAPFVYSKAKAAQRFFSEPELHRHLEQLLLMTHAVRAGRGDLPVMLEKWILGLG